MRKSFIRKSRTGSTKQAPAAQNALLTAIKQPQVKMTLTENAAPTFAETGNKVLDFFSLGGALRSRDEASIEKLFANAFHEDKRLATKAAFYVRDMRGGGPGERRTFRIALRWLASNYPDIVRKNMSNIPEYGRWDDLFVLLGTKVQEEMFELVEKQLKADQRALKKGEGVSLLGKWMPSENTSSEATRNIANQVRRLLGMTPKAYRKMLSKLREEIAIVERAMCSGEWGAINYEHIPSRASLIYRKAFSKHDAIRYTAFLGEVAQGKKTIKTSALFPYDIVEKIMAGEHDATLELQWKGLPNYLEERPHNGLAIVDVSGSMMGKRQITGANGKKTHTVEPLCASLSLGLYLAERIEGAFKNHFITFSADPVLQEVRGTTLRDRINSLRFNGGYNTNFQKVFDVILNTAVRNRVPQSEMPEILYCLTDCEFDNPQNGPKTNFETVKEKYAKAGYKMPLLVFWNLDSRQNQAPVTAKEGIVILVSGYSASLFKLVLTGKQEPEAPEVTPLEKMLQVLNSERYDKVVA